MRFFKAVERLFAVICVVATLLGLLVPEVGRPLAGLTEVFLAGILFFTGLRLDLREALSYLARPWLVIYATFMLMIPLPLGVYSLSRLFLPENLACGVIIVAAMPAGLACSSLTQIAGGRAALALVVTLFTSLVCPLVTPWIIRVCAGLSPAVADSGWRFLGRQALFLALILFSPVLAALLVRRLLPGAVARIREACTGLSMISLALLIVAAMSETSADFMEMILERPGAVAALAVFMFGFSGLLHVAGYLLAPWRPRGERVALSVNSAYVNNGLAIVFGREFFAAGIGAAAVLPAIMLEIPMILAIQGLRFWMRRKSPADAAPPDDR